MFYGKQLQEQNGKMFTLTQNQYVYEMNYAKQWEVQKCVLYITLWKKTMNELPEQIYASSIACLTSKDVLYGEKYMVSLDYYSLWGYWRNGFQIQRRRRILMKLSLIER
jgi:hypothetical protein